MLGPPPPKVICLGYRLAHLWSWSPVAKPPKSTSQLLSLGPNGTPCHMLLIKENMWHLSRKK